jgi:pre-mRNA-processing factor 19
MSFNICALSGIIVENPVVSKKTGHIFEKRLIEKHIDATGRCPISKLELGQDDLVLIKVDKKIKPRLVNQASMSGLFSELQSEWDKIITETFTCKTELDAAKKELAHILYQSDAATRVICNLIKERDLAREALANYRDEFEEIDEEGLAGEEFDNMGMYSELIERITETTFKLIADRKSRKQSESFANFEQMSKYESKFSTFPLAKLQNEGANTNPTGITCSDLHKNHSNYMIAGCNNGTTAFLEINSEGKVIELKSHKKINGSNVNDIEFYPSANYLAFGACYDNNTASFFNLNTDGDIVEKYRIKSHLESMTGISFHPLQDYAFLSSLDGYWSFHNLLKVIFIIYFLGGVYPQRILWLLD